MGKVGTEKNNRETGRKTKRQPAPLPVKATVAAGSELISLPSGWGSSLTIVATDTQDRGIKAMCTSTGWFPEPKVEWWDLRGQPVPSKTYLLGLTRNLWTVASTVTLQDRTVGGLTCSISNPLLPEKNVTETYLLGEYFSSSAITARSAGPGWQGC